MERGLRARGSRAETRPSDCEAAIVSTLERRSFRSLNVPFI